MPSSGDLHTHRLYRNKYPPPAADRVSAGTYSEEVRQNHPRREWFPNHLPTQSIEHYYDIEPAELATQLFPTIRRELQCVNGQVNGPARMSAEEFRKEILALIGRKINVKLFCHANEIETHGRLRFLQELSRSDHGEVRVSPTNLHGAYFFDRRTALIWNASPGDRHCMILRFSTLVDPLLRLTDTAWETAVDLAAFLRYRADTEREKQFVLHLLGAGYKDEAAARKLGVSVRTYRRYVAEVMNRLGAKSRFEAGVRATRLGLVSSEPGADPVE